MPFASRMKPGKKAFARKLRKNPTPSERELWQYIRRDQLGVRFVRQMCMLGYIADFYCAQYKLVIEIDGSSHDGKTEYDQHRDNVMEQHGLNVMRIPADKVMTNIDTVLVDICAKLSTCPLAFKRRESKRLQRIRAALAL